MTRSTLVATRRLALVLALAATAACAENTAPGNDREAALDPPATAAEVVPAGEALRGVATGLLMPQIMTDADLRNVPAVDGRAESADRCSFRMTRVDHPVLVYGTAAVIKLNGKLIPLAGIGEGRYGAEGVEVTVRPLEDDAGSDSPFLAELVLRFSGAPNELGFHGFSQCGSERS